VPLDGAVPNHPKQYEHSETEGQAETSLATGRVVFAAGNGEILMNYCCTPGTVVDRYRPGQSTYLLISLREPKRRGDEDEFHIEWGIRNGFVRASELWETEIRHRTKALKVSVIFPKARPPRKTWLEENIRRKKLLLMGKSMREMADGRWQLAWEMKKPRLNERYRLSWEW